MTWDVPGIPGWWDRGEAGGCAVATSALLGQANKNQAVSGLTHLWSEEPCICLISVGISEEMTFEVDRKP